MTTFRALYVFRPSDDYVHLPTSGNNNKVDMPCFRRQYFVVVVILRDLLCLDSYGGGEGMWVGGSHICVETPRDDRTSGLNTYK